MSSKTTVALALSLVAMIVASLLYYATYTSYASLVRELEVLREESNSMKSELSRVSQDVLHLSKKIDDSVTSLGLRVSSLEDTVVLLSKRVSGAEESIKTLSESYKQALDSITRLERRLGSLADTLESRYSDLQQKYSSLEKTISAVNSRYSDLANQLSTLQQRLGSLENRYNELYQLYNQLREKIDSLYPQIQILLKYRVAIESIQVWYYYLADPEGLKKLLQVSETIDIVNRFAAGIQGGLLEERAWKILSLMSKIFMYQYDVFARVAVLDASVAVRMDIIQLPNETVSRLGGDCEDLALFAYSVLRASAKPGEEIYMLFISASPVGHAVVLAIDKSTRRIYLIDPTTSFMNGYSIYLAMNVLSSQGTSQRVYIQPMKMSPDQKLPLLAYSLAELIYFDEYAYMSSGEKREFNQPPQVYNLSADQQISMYLRWFNIAPAGFIVASSKEVLFFTSIQELVNWINQKLS